MISILDMTSGQVIDNRQLCDTFKCSEQGGMRRSKRTNTLVIVSNHIKSIYDDRWVGETFFYTGMGTKGDQKIDFMQNKTLAESNVNGVQIHLFEVFKAKEYTYVGEVNLCEAPFTEEQLDEDKRSRKVFVFPLQLKEGRPPKVPKETLKLRTDIKVKQAKKLSLDELKLRASRSHKKPGSREVSITQYERNEWVTEYSKRRANGVCDLCDGKAPFSNKKNEPYLENHHIEWLAKGGEDTIENCVALCPNCHRKMHVLNEEKDVQFLQRKNSSR